MVRGRTPRAKYSGSVVYAMSRDSNISGCALVRLLAYAEISKPLKRTPARAETSSSVGKPGKVVSNSALLGSCCGSSDFCAVECCQSIRAYGLCPAHSAKWYSPDAVNDHGAPSSALPLVAIGLDAPTPGPVQVPFVAS